MGAGVQFVVVCAVQVLVFHCADSVTHVYTHTLSLSLKGRALYKKSDTSNASSESNKKNGKTPFFGFRSMICLCIRMREIEREDHPSQCA